MQPDLKTRSLIVALALAANPWLTDTGYAKDIAGYVERARIYPGGLFLSAKLDTGAENSSLNAANVQKFEREGKTWVRFEITNAKSRTIVLERPIHRTARVRRHGGRAQERDVLLLWICLGTVLKEVEVNIIDRTGFNYQLLIGRSYLSGNFLVDSDESFLVESSCPDRLPE